MGRSTIVFTQKFPSNIHLRYITTKTINFWILWKNKIKFPILTNMLPKLMFTLIHPIWKNKSKTQPKGNLFILEHFWLRKCFQLPNNSMNKDSRLCTWNFLGVNLQENNVPKFKFQRPSKVTQTLTCTYGQLQKVNLIKVS